MTSNRQHPRFEHQAKVTLHTASTTVECTTANVSRGGLCVIAVAEVAIGLSVDVEFEFDAGGTGRSEGLRVPARVLWVTAVDETFQIGMSWQELDAGTLRGLQRYLKDIITPAAGDDDEIFAEAERRSHQVR